jgi:hypothetical protein
MKKEKRDARISFRLPRRLLTNLDKLAALAHLDRTDYLRVKLEEIAERESLAATGGQS